ncbi:hypothetical protein BYT27DRAFT_7248402 [Phlegmacium glaucopus]|nr:hypothetical protein BYT27DRAFT_7248402 [Phlegmacium glaucopus]
MNTEDELGPNTTFNIGDEDNSCGDDIEDDWVDPSLLLPMLTSQHRPLSKPQQQQQQSPPPVPMKDNGSPISSSSSSPHSSFFKDQAPIITEELLNFK